MRSDEVNAKLSASKMEAASLCPAYFQANKLFAWQGDRDSANEGTIRHENEENEVPINEIDDDERRLCAIRCRQALEECRQKVFGEQIGLGVVCRELRLWYGESWSGQLDYVETHGVEKVFIADYKTLHGSHTPPQQIFSYSLKQCYIGSTIQVLKKFMQHLLSLLIALHTLRFDIQMSF